MKIESFSLMSLIMILLCSCGAGAAPSVGQTGVDIAQTKEATDPACFKFDKYTGAITDFYDRQCPERDIIIPSSISGVKVRLIAGYAFYKNKRTSVVIPDSVTTIGAGAFRDNQLTSVIIPDSVTTIRKDAFKDNQLTSVTIPDSVTAIKENAFADNQLTSATIPNSDCFVDSYAFDRNVEVLRP